MDIKNLTSIVVKDYKTGFYLRVLEEGIINKEDCFELISREKKQYSIEFINKCAFNAKNNQENIKRILLLNKLSNSYKNTLEKKLI